MRMKHYPCRCSHFASSTTTTSAHRHRTFTLSHMKNAWRMHGERSLTGKKTSWVIFVAYLPCILVQWYCRQECSRNYFARLFDPTRTKFWIVLRSASRGDTFTSIGSLHIIIRERVIWLIYLHSFKIDESMLWSCRLPMRIPQNHSPRLVLSRPSG